MVRPIGDDDDLLQTMRDDLLEFQAVIDEEVAKRARMTEMRRVKTVGPHQLSLVPLPKVEYNQYVTQWPDRYDGKPIVTTADYHDWPVLSVGPVAFEAGWA